MPSPVAPPAEVAGMVLIATGNIFITQPVLLINFEGTKQVCSRTQGGPWATFLSVPIPFNLRMMFFVGSNTAVYG